MSDRSEDFSGVKGFDSADAPISNSPVRALPEKGARILEELRLGRGMGRISSGSHEGRVRDERPSTDRSAMLADLQRRRIEQVLPTEGLSDGFLNLRASGSRLCSAPPDTNTGPVLANDARRCTDASVPSPADSRGLSLTSGSGLRDRVAPRLEASGELCGRVNDWRERDREADAARFERAAEATFSRVDQKRNPDFFLTTKSPAAQDQIRSRTSVPTRDPNRESFPPSYPSSSRPSVPSFSMNEKDRAKEFLSQQHAAANGVPESTAAAWLDLIPDLPSAKPEKQKPRPKKSSEKTERMRMWGGCGVLPPELRRKCTVGVAAVIAVYLRAISRSPADFCDWTVAAIARAAGVERWTVQEANRMIARGEFAGLQIQRPVNHGPFTDTNIVTIGWLEGTGNWAKKQALRLKRWMKRNQWFRRLNLDNLAGGLESTSTKERVYSIREATASETDPRYHDYGGMKAIFSG